MVSPSLTASSAWAARTTWSRATRTRALTKKGYFFVLKLGYMLPATRNNSTEAVNESGKFCKAPKLFGKTKRWKAGLTSFNNTLEPLPSIWSTTNNVV
jgi:hypothetical protein